MTQEERIPMRKAFIAAAGAAIIGALLLLPGVASAGPAARHYGPFASTSPDSGSCGNNWATDTFERHFTVKTSLNDDGTYTVTQQFMNGSFVTIGGASPGNCDTTPAGTGTVGAGVTGKMQGSFTIVVTNGTYNPAATCPAICTTTGFVASVFGSTATYDVPTFIFHYSAGNNGEWKNASADRGGNHGDITGNP